MTAVDVKPACGNPKCKIASTGECFEGLTEDTCGFFAAAVALEGAPIEATDTEQVGPSAPVVRLPSGNVLGAVEARDMLAIGGTRLIAVIGPRDSGKTSLIASVYEMLGLDRVPAYNFAGSRTLVSFEQTCHDSRADSERKAAVTERTNRNTLGFFHVCVAPKDSGVRTHLIFADRAGEHYLSLVDGVDKAHQLLELGAADVITILVDGERMAGGNEWMSAVRSIELIVQNIIETGALCMRPSLAVVLTKLDKIAEKQSAHDRFDRLVAKLRRLFGDDFAEIKEYRIAACPTEAGWERGHGITPLIDFWHDSPINPLDFAREYQDAKRSFGRLSPIGDVI